MKPRIWCASERPPADAVLVGKGSIYANRCGVLHSPEALAMYAKHVLPHLEVIPLRGKHLICSCSLSTGHVNCHAELLMMKANGLPLPKFDRHRPMLHEVIWISRWSKDHPDDARRTLLTYERQLAKFQSNYENFKGKRGGAEKCVSRES